MTVFDLAGGRGLWGLLPPISAVIFSGERGEFRDDVGMLGGEVGRFADFLIEVVEARVFRRRRRSGVFAHAFLLRGERELPRAGARPRRL